MVPLDVEQENQKPYDYDHILLKKNGIFSLKNQRLGVTSPFLKVDSSWTRENRQSESIRKVLVSGRNRYTYTKVFDVDFG